MEMRVGIRTRFGRTRSIVAALVTTARGSDAGRSVDYWFLGASGVVFIAYHVAMWLRLRHWYSMLDGRVPARVARGVARVPVADETVPVFRLTGCHRRRPSPAARVGNRASSHSAVCSRGAGDSSL